MEIRIQIDDFINDILIRIENRHIQKVVWFKTLYEI